MGILKFEIELPDFKDELSINLTLKRDGTIIESYTPDKSVVIPPSPKVVEKKKNTNPPTMGGNMMNIEF